MPYDLAILLPIALKLNIITLWPSNSTTKRNEYLYLQKESYNNVLALFMKVKQTNKQKLERTQCKPAG